MMKSRLAFESGSLFSRRANRIFALPRRGLASLGTSTSKLPGRILQGEPHGFRHRLPLSSSSTSIQRHLPSISSPRYISISTSTMCRNSGAISHTTPQRQLLPQNVKPYHYALVLDPDFSTFKFDGSVTILLDVAETSNYVTLHTLDTEIKSAKLITSEGHAVDSSSITHDDDLQAATFKFPVEFKAGEKVQIAIEFVGELNNKMAGFYRSSYTDKDGKEAFIASTQMEPTDCRRAFPSFDEPALKATFDISLIHDPKLVALANAEVKTEKDLPNGKKQTDFATTPVLSTYLVAFAIGDLRYVESNKARYPVRVYTTPGIENQGEFSADLAARTLNFYEEKFDIKLPVKKMDFLAVPEFSAGAMENLGLITFRVVDLLLDEKTASVNTKQRVAEVVQHELAHQWFGDLVTMDWWEGLWLNEGFATWMSWYSCNTFYPEWKVWESYVGDNLENALSLDGMRSSHPIEVPVQRADEINQIFDAISYSKGSVVLKMIANWLGEDVFIKGIQRYLKKHLYGNTKTSDLWAALSEESGKDVSQVMDIWTKKVGYPVVSVTERGSAITVEQHRFLASGDVKPEEDKIIYPVFLGLKTENNIDKDSIFFERTKTIELPSTKFFKLNADQTAFFRTAYSTERLNKLGNAGNDGLLSVEDRTGLLSDATALARSGYSKTSGLLNLVSSWKDESHYVVWAQIISSLGAIKMAWLFESEAILEAQNSLRLSLVADKAHKVGWKFKDSDSFADQQLKALLFGAACGAKDPIALKSSHDLFAKYIAGDKDAIHPNIKGTVFSTVVKHEGTKAWDSVFSIYQNPISPSEKISALRALGNTEDPSLIKKTLKIALDEKIVKPQDIYVSMGGLISHRPGVEALWDWLKVNWDVIVKILPPGLSMLSSVVKIGTMRFTTEKQAKAVEEFFADKDTKGFDQALAQSLESIRSKAAWVSRDSEDVKHWFTNHGYLKK